MEITRKFEDVEIRVKVTDDELLELISNKNIDERIVFFRKLFETDMGNTFPFNLMKKLLKKT